MSFTSSDTADISFFAVSFFRAKIGEICRKWRIAFICFICLPKQIKNSVFTRAFSRAMAHEHTHIGDIRICAIKTTSRKYSRVITPQTHIQE